MTEEQVGVGVIKALVLFKISWQNRLLYKVIDFFYPKTLRLDINLPFYSHKGSLQEKYIMLIVGSKI